MLSLIFSSIFNCIQHLIKKRRIQHVVKINLYFIYSFLLNPIEIIAHLITRVHFVDSTQVYCSHVDFFRFYISKYQVQILHPGTNAHCMNFEHMKIYQ